MNGLRYWCAVAQFDGCEQFIFGHVEARSDMDAEAQLKELWRQMIPVDPPKFIEVFAGELVLRRA